MTWHTRSSLASERLRRDRFSGLVLQFGVATGTSLRRIAERLLLRADDRDGGAARRGGCAPRDDEAVRHAAEGECDEEGGAHRASRSADGEADDAAEDEGDERDEEDDESCAGSRLRRTVYGFDSFEGLPEVQRNVM